MDSKYWLNEYNKLVNSPPPKPESYYNKDFVERMNEARSSIDNLVAEKDKAWAAQGQKMDEYNAFYGKMESYGDVHKRAENEFGVATAKDNYEKTKQALALTETALEALPSSINAQSARTLTKSQKEARYNTLADVYMGTRNDMAKAAQTYEQAWKNARENQSTYAKAEIAQQYSRLGDFNQAWVNSMNEYSAAGKNLLAKEEELRNWKSDYRNWQQMQYQNAASEYYAKLTAANNRYLQALQTESLAARLSRQSANIGKYLNNQKSWDFGDGYSVRDAGGYAFYYKDGQRISAGSFIEHTGASGARWDLWNSIWASGTKTDGVGSDTIEAFNYKSSTDPKYKYLFT